MEDAIIRYYFVLGLKHSEILAYLQLRFNIHMSLSTLKRKLQQLNLFRRKKFSSLEDVIFFIEEQLEQSAQLHGYRWMHLKCIQNGLILTQRTVRLILKELDPIGVEIRSRRRLRRRRYAGKGPNFVWHVDSYDKLKPYGVAINGAIDGFSRKIIWLHAAKTASDPKIIGGYFINTLKKYNGCPRRVRSDLGTENRYIEQFQMFLRRNAVDQNDHLFGECSHLYGTSQSNQRIECWWSMLRKHNSQYWMNLFENIKDEGLFTGSDLDKSLIQFCFLKMIQDELNTLKKEWNSHFIRGSRNSVLPYGRPMIMFNLPELYNTVNYLCDVDEIEIETCSRECVFLGEMVCDSTIFELASILMEELQLNQPTNSHEGVNLYITLRNQILLELATH